jgi:hypothetical protein
MQPYFSENEVSRRKAETKATGDQYLLTAHLRKPRRNWLARLAAALREMLGGRRRPAPGVDAPVLIDRTDLSAT